MQTPYDALGGAATMRSLVEAFYPRVQRDRGRRGGMRRATALLAAAVVLAGCTAGPAAGGSPGHGGGERQGASVPQPAHARGGTTGPTRAQPPAASPSAPPATALAGAATPSVVAPVQGSSPSVPALSAVFFLDGTHGWAGGQGLIIATTDGGQVWQAVYTGSGDVTQLDFVTAADGWALQTGGGLLRTAERVWGQCDM